MQKTVSIIGCGWLGLPLAQSLLKEGYKVFGTTTSASKLESLSRAGIQASLLELGSESENNKGQNELFQAETFIINFPPRRIPEVIRIFPLQVKQLCELINNKSKNIIFISSTSVYPSENKPVTEDDAIHPEKPSGKALLIAEAILKSYFGNRLTILRAGGLIGYNRSAKSILGKGKVMKNIDAPLNLVHRDDCIEIVKSILKKEFYGEILNVVCDIYPTRRDFYGLEDSLPRSIEANSYKIVDNSKLKQQLDYSFIHPNPLKIDD